MRTLILTALVAGLVLPTTTYAQRGGHSGGHSGGHAGGHPGGGSWHGGGAHYNGSYYNHSHYHYYPYAYPFIYAGYGLGYGYGYYNDYPSYYDSGRYSYYPPLASVTDSAPPAAAALPTPPPDQAYIRIVVPDPNAEVKLEGQAMTTLGQDRMFSSPKLEPGFNYNYTVTASWLQQGRLVQQTLQVPLAPGRVSLADFTRPQQPQQPAQPVQPPPPPQPQLK
jgi:uncharacterized protein (TIGR03000 family)